MFRFKALELMNWDCYPHYRVPLNGEIILLVGPNGSGKTTFLDALRVLLNSPRLSKSRSLHHYIAKDVEVAMLKGVVTNQLVAGRRPFAHLGIYGDADVSLLCIIRNRGPQRIDKEYFIVKGDIDLEDIKKLKGGMRSLQYSRQLEEAGVSRSTLKLIALEQGETDRIGQLSANDLMQLVMDITGNRDIIKRYEEARRNYRRSYQQLVELRSEYNKICQQNEELERQAKQAQSYKELLDEQRLIEEEKLPLAKWYQLLDQIHDIEKSCLELVERKLAMTKKIRSLGEEMEVDKGKVTQIDQEQQQVKKRELQQEQELRQLHQQIGQCNSEWQRLDALRRDCQNLDAADPQQIQQQLDQSQALYYQRKNEMSQAQAIMADKKKELAAIEQNRLPTYPAEVYEILELLSRQSIKHLLFADAIEIIESKWQLAIEAFLGRERFTVFVDHRDFLAAKKLGEKYRYGYYISAYDTRTLPAMIRHNSILAKLKIVDERITGRLGYLNDIILVDTIEEGHHYQDQISITASGYRQDRRGGIFIAHKVRFYCGGLARERQLQEAQEQITEQRERIAELQLQLQLAHRQVQDGEEQLVSLKRQEEWLASQELYHSLKKQGETLLAASETLVRAREDTLSEVDQLTEERNKANLRIRDLEKEKERLERERAQIDDLVYEKEQMLLQVKWQKQELDKQIPSATKSTYTPEQLESPDWLVRKLEELRHKIEMFSGCRDVVLITLYEHEHKQMQSKKQQLERQEEDQRQRSQELEKCREDYKEMIVHTIGFYNKSVKELAELAGCKMQVFHELGRGESLIEDSKLHVKVAFDQKREVDIRDRSLSGGQDVIASLILLVALSRIEQDRSSGFFIMDEHNAHLDMRRIMEVGHFLRSTRAQFVLTTPTTENVAALSVADLTLSFSKKEGQSPFAPKPRYLRRM